MHAAPPGNTTYKGTASNSASVTLATAADGKQTTIDWQEVGVEGAGCSGSSGSIINHFTSDDTGFWGGSTTPTGSGTIGNRGYNGYYGDAGAAAGAYGFDSAGTAVGCGNVRNSYLAVDAANAAVRGPGLTPNGIYTGAITDVMPDGGIRGNIEIRANAAGTAIDRLTITYNEGACSYPVSLTNIDLNNAKSFQAGIRTVTDAATNRPRVPSAAGVTRGVTRMAGGFSHPGSTGCPGVSGFWQAVALTTASPTPTATAAPSASATPTATTAAGASAGTPKVNGSIPAAGGIGLVVFTGGTSAQLVTASGCPTASAAFWADDGAGGFVTYVPGAAVAVVNAAWNAKFPNGVPANTALIGRCRWRK